MTRSSAAERPPETLYRRIRADIEARILSGAWPPGHRVPFEHELMSEYGCSRMTVNKALSELANAELIERRKRAGTFVRQPKVLSAVLEIADIPAEITALGRRYDYRLIARRERQATRADRRRLRTEDAGDILAIECCHSADGVPFAYEERLIDLAAVPEARTADLAAEPPGTWLLQHVPWNEAEHCIGAVAADAEIALRLGLAEGTACLVIERHTWRNNRTLTAVRLVYPGAVHQLVARFARR